MAYKCDNCFKGIMYGHNVSHAKNRTNRTFKPNLQYTRIKINGKMIRARLCTNCIKLNRKIRKEREELVKTQQLAANESPATV